MMARTLPCSASRSSTPTFMGIWWPTILKSWCFVNNYSRWSWMRGCSNYKKRSLIIKSPTLTIPKTNAANVAQKLTTNIVASSSGRSSWRKSTKRDDFYICLWCVLWTITLPLDTGLCCFLLGLWHKDTCFWLSLHQWIGSLSLHCQVYPLLIQIALYSGADRNWEQEVPRQLLFGVHMS